MGPYNSTEIDQLVGDNLKILRVHSGFSQRLVAKHLGVSSQQVQKYETGKNRISAGRLFVLAALFDVPVVAFYEGVSKCDC